MNMKNVPFIDLHAQYNSLQQDIRKAITKVFAQSSFILGKEVERFEKSFARYCGVRYCLGVNSGTSALHLALLGLGVERGDEVITQPNTFFATAEAIWHTGATPVFVDIAEGQYGMSAEKLEKAITKKTRCILPVHLFGGMADIERIQTIAKKHKIRIVEDACQAHGVRHRGKQLGTFGDVGCFSFYPGKVLGAAGEAGAIVTNNRKLYLKMKALRDHGQTSKNHHQLIGHNFRMEELQGAVLGVKLKRLNQWILQRRKHAKLYNTLLKGIVATPSDSSLRSSNFQYYVVRCKERDELKKYLEKAGISTLIHYPTPIHLTRAFRFLGYRKGDFPVAEKTAKEILSLPMYPEINMDDQKYVVQKIQEFYSKE